MLDFLLSHYDFDLPEELIAQRPVEPRDHSRLLIYKRSSDEVIHEHFYNLPNYLDAGSSLVFNNTKVFPCRLLGKKASGGKAEVFLLERNANDAGVLKALIKTSGKKRVGDTFEFDSVAHAQIVELGEGGVFYLNFSGDFEKLIEQHAKIPIPPYIRGGVSDESDRSDYQTYFAKSTGSVAAPTAGLHFSEDTFKQLDERGIEQNYVTLHVGLGTFAPVKVDDIREHRMHEEDYLVEKEQWQKIQKAQKRIAVGTTSLRTLESLWEQEGEYLGDELQSTSIFLHPGREIKSVSGLLTNFHLPKSTLLMLVSALTGRQRLLELYEEAIKKKYRFFSYGDAMLIID
jgi:S-adenosylmethionine:tRNA ribosyltransferase-isomerase